MIIDSRRPKTENMDEMPSHKLTSICDPDGYEIPEVDMENPQVTLVPGQPIIIKYADGKVITLELNQGVKFSADKFMAQNANIINAAVMYHNMIARVSKDTPLTPERMARVAESVLVLNSGGLSMRPQGTAVTVTMDSHIAQGTTFNSDIIPGFLLNYDRLRCDKMTLDSDRNITSAIISISPDSKIPLEYDFELLGQALELAANV